MNLREKLAGERTSSPVRCTEPGCPNPQGKGAAGKRGLCNVHYRRNRPADYPANAAAERGGLPVGGEKKDEKKEPGFFEKAFGDAPGISKAEVESAIVVTMGLLATTLDESFTASDEKGNALPHVKDAVEHMMPVVQRHGAFLVKALPYLAFLHGCGMIMKPGLDASIEIAAGVRKPRFMRRPKVNPDGSVADPDIYTEEFKAAVLRMQQEQQAAQQNGGQEPFDPAKGHKAKDGIVSIPPS